MLPCVNFINLVRNDATVLHHAKSFHNTVSFGLSLCPSVYLYEYVNNAVTQPPESHRQHSCLNLISLNGIIFSRMQVDL